MASTYKAQAIARKLHDSLQLRLQTATYFVNDISFDTDGSPFFTINDGTPASHEKNWILKVAPVSWPLAKDILGNSAIQYTPHAVQIAWEAGAASNFGDFAAMDVMKVLGESTLQGCRVELYMRTAGTAVAITDITAGNLQGTFEPNQFYPLVDSQ